MYFFKDLTGQRFGRLLVLKRIGKQKDRHITWECLCDCGNVIIANGKTLRSGGTKSCGCLLEEVRKVASIKHGKKTSATKNKWRRLYRIWSGIKTRCLNPKNHAYKDYGDRGIKICDEWKDDFDRFSDWSIRNGYDENLSIDRIDNDGDYCPENCRWVTDEIQRSNRRDSHFLIVNGEKKTVTQWACLVGMKPHTLYARIRKGWDAEKAVLTPVMTKRKVE